VTWPPQGDRGLLCPWIQNRCMHNRLPLLPINSVIGGTVKPGKHLQGKSVGRTGRRRYACCLCRVSLASNKGGRKRARDGWFDAHWCQNGLCSVCFLMIRLRFQGGSCRSEQPFRAHLHSPGKELEQPLLWLFSVFGATRHTKCCI
jgi:hypothetical protein